MKPTLLLDLDDTLLVNDIDKFLTPYFRALTAHMAAYVAPDRLVSSLMAASRAMTFNQRPDCTLKQVFDDAFYPALGIDPVLIQSEIDVFYAEIFPTLRQWTSPMPGAVALVEEALRRGYRLVVATNPLFPLTAILQRLEWAGLSPEHYPFDLITSYETFHFAKPNPAYYAEVLARLGWPEGPVVSVGNDLGQDILPSRELGLAAYYVHPAEAVPDTPLDPQLPHGSLEGFLPWLDSTGEDNLLPDYTAPASMLAILRSTPAAFLDLSQQMEPAAWNQRPRPEEWAFTEILCHLRDVEREVNRPRLEQVLQENNPFLPGKDTDPWAVERGYIQQDSLQALHRFIAERMETVTILENIQASDWQRTARHAILGRTNLAELVNIIASHDRLHLQQAHCLSKS